jgi:GNAT superfamily N-acetyltransferase
MFSIELKKKAIKYLMKDEISNIDILEPIRRGVADIIYAEGDGVIIKEKISESCMVSMSSLEKFKTLIKLENYDLFAVHQPDIAEWIQQEKNCNEKFEAYQAVYTKKEKIETSFDMIRNLSNEYLNEIYENYHSMDDKKYIVELIERKHIWGIFEEEKLAGFIGIHSEGSMGLLEVLTDYRRKGYGYKLEAFLINYFLESDMVPFCQVIAGNKKSFDLQKKLGMKISQGTTTWIF